ncbi:hypothetical protein [Dyella agri]|uniref:Uncharacterized protein n=1 Tax=Dyella agri TaxID=1926869 RepID=A0ABW8KDB7_9GAMM
MWRFVVFHAPARNESGGKPTIACSADFHDITRGRSGSYTAVADYDRVTGWGSPKVALISALIP